MATGLQFRKIDLHVHTKASYDFQGEVSPEDIVNEAIRKELDAIAVTDHNTAVWLDKVKEAARNTNLIVFPGVEISCIGGERGIHIIALFDPSQDSNHVMGLLGALDIQPEDHGKPESLVNKNVVEVIDVIDKWNGLAVLAHANSSKGVLHDMRGQQRIRVIQHPKLLAVEATDFNKTEGRRTIDFLDGTDPTYKRHLAVYQASDNPSVDNQGGHSLEGIGNRYSYFKLDLINLEGIRQCFIHPESRIKVDYIPNNYNRLISMKAGNSGFLKNQEFEFHEGLNSIIGGKGVGKSLAVEFIRFCLDDPPTNQDLAQDHLRKLEKQLQIDNSVEVVYELENGTRYKIKRVLLGTGRANSDSTFECINLDTDEVYEGDIREMFPILAYSQTEVIKISENKNAQLELIDRFVNKQPHIQAIKDIQIDLDDNDTKFSKALDAQIRLAQCVQDINTLQERISNINKALSNELFELMKQTEAKKRQLEKGAKEIQELSDKISLVSVEIQEMVQDEQKLIATATDAAILILVKLCQVPG